MLIELRLSEIAALCDGELIGSDQVITSVTTDTRAISESCLFVALRGQYFDGHDFAAAAIEQGAVGVLSDHDLELACYVKVSDTLCAYGRVARRIRDAFAFPVVAITGSNGKTTVKDWLAQSLDDKNVLKTRANLNNRIGVPQTLLALSADHDVAVIEAGTSFTGEIPLLVNIICPDVVILTNASGSHFEGLGSIEGIAKEKGALITGATSHAKVILNADDAFFAYWCDLAEGRDIMSFGFTSQASLYASDVRLGPESSKAVFHYKAWSIGVTIAGAGRHQIANGMAVVLALVALGVDFPLAVTKLLQPILVPGRMARLKTTLGALLIDDSYNASPTSVEAAIDVLVSQQVQQTWLVLGALGELGDQEQTIHRQLGVYAKQKGVSHLICVGSVACTAGIAFREQGGHAILCDTHNEAVQIVDELDETHAILVKGSRSAKMETVIKALLN
ncbi:UDP-N-acetylmuramoyl-tripeptide--D-alanyl-D-alanine ligase [Marinomonas algarum]|uniref:UDP-N-acetylmuramoyl-tripeptide--D-alanyl-D-alanine ligase n=1 Tax=Marinomonas algarum TaxID=2883105 RepID=A0A9X1LEM0_9GAMM|nr:UDP-N-acetylmuramoyl-tripeptide--D-alanyl-D-alanine ligase [Marinomonas algarum]MCB5161410.1 UDP-N-acetylmuramoyl-tripeptide--D-alanyl-D-alanine ligase [Marinomonas algarum]